MDKKLTEQSGELAKINQQLQEEIKERKLREEEYKFLLQASMDGFWRVDSSGKILEVNDAYSSITGYRREELLQMRIQDLEAMEFPAETARHIQKIIKQGFDRFETKHRAKDGRILDIEVSTYYLDFKGGELFTFCRDITEKKQAEATLRQYLEELKEYQEIINRTPVMVFSWKNTEDFPVEFVSENVERYLGYSADDFLSGRVSWVGITHPEDVPRLLAELEKHKAKGAKEFSQQYRLHTQSGKYVWIEDQTIPVQDEQGNITHYKAILLDITERKSAEMQKEQLISELKDALAKVKTLSGLLPICAACKKIRDDQGYWKQIEAYIESHSKVEFTHGLCPECVKKLYPGL